MEFIAFFKLTKAILRSDPVQYTSNEKKVLTIKKNTIPIIPCVTYCLIIHPINIINQAR